MKIKVRNKFKLLSTLSCSLSPLKGRERRLIKKNKSFLNQHEFIKVILICKTDYTKCFHPKRHKIRNKLFAIHSKDDA